MFIKPSTIAAKIIFILVVFASFGGCNEIVLESDKVNDQDESQLPWLESHDKRPFTDTSA